MAAAILANPAHLLATDAAGKVTLAPGQSIAASNLPADYLSSAEQAQLTTIAADAHTAATGVGTINTSVAGVATTATTISAKLGTPAGASVSADIATANTGIATANTGIATANTGIATANTGIATANTGIATANTGIAEIATDADAIKTRTETLPAFPANFSLLTISGGGAVTTANPAVTLSPTITAPLILTPTIGGR